MIELLADVLIFVFGAVVVYPIFTIEALLVVLLIVPALGKPLLAHGQLSAIENALQHLARKRAAVVLGVGVLTLVVRALLFPILPVREPSIQDEFSHLLAADTFASGRLTNPTHPMWVFFETLHVNQQPTYMSMYPPAQGLALAAGKVIFGHPLAGAWISAALMCSALCWMLQGWLPPLWAMAGGLLAVLRYAVFSYWMNSYWGGAAAAIGGALVLGALPRIMRSRRVRDSIWMGLGLAILAHSRPYEGVVLSIPVAVILFVWLWRSPQPLLRLALARVVLPLALMLTVAGVATGYYFWRVTGDPTLMPYVLNTRTYGRNNPLPSVLFHSNASTPKYNHEAMRRYYTEWIPNFQRPVREPPLAAAVAHTSLQIGSLWTFFLGPVLTIPLLFLHKAVTRRRLRVLALIGVVCFVGATLESPIFPHYLGPVTGLVLVFLIQSLRHLRVWRPRGKPVGLCLAHGVLVISAAGLLLVPINYVTGSAPSAESPLSWCYTGPGNVERARILTRLNKTMGNHLVLVRYASSHDSPNEWVNNAPDINAAKVVWAREMTQQENARLCAYFRGRHVWLLEPDVDPPRLTALANLAQ
ncbi:MAG: hypothetical protein ABFD89_07725 [Bryobacteraceae bacterium]